MKQLVTAPFDAQCGRRTRAKWHHAAEPGVEADGGWTLRLLVVLSMSLFPCSVTANPCQEYIADRHLERLLEAHAGLARPATFRWAARVFFDALPDSFACYKAVFDDPGPLSEGPVMDDVFPKLRAAVPERTYIRKLVRLSVGATWQPDQISHLQHAARVALTDSPAAFVRELDALNARHEAGVWDFLFGGPDPGSEPLSAGLQKRICSLSARSCESSADAYARALARQRSGGSVDDLAGVRQRPTTFGSSRRKTPMAIGFGYSMTWEPTAPLLEGRIACSRTS